MKNLVFVMVLLNLIACSHSSKVYDYDPTSSESEVPNEGITPNIGSKVLVAENQGVVVYVVRSNDFYDDQNGVNRQRWDVFITNESIDNKCISIVWKLSDFDLLASYPAKFYIPTNNRLFYGSMIGNVWNLDGVPIVPEPSGYVYQLSVTETYKTENQNPYRILESCEQDIVDM